MTSLTQTVTAHRFRSLTVGAAFVAYLALAAPTLAVELLAGDNMDGGYVGSGIFHGVGYTNNATVSNEATGQRFRVGVSGQLTRLEATVERFRGGEPLVVSIHQDRPTVSGFVPGARLGSLTVPEVQVGDDVVSGLSRFDLSPLGLDLLAGGSYIVTFKTSTALFQDVRYRALSTELNANSFGYPSLFSRDGVNWEQSTVAEIGLRMYVDAVPEPPSLGLIAIAMVFATRIASMPGSGKLGVASK